MTAFLTIVGNVLLAAVVGAVVVAVVLWWSLGPDTVFDVDALDPSEREAPDA